MKWDGPRPRAVPKMRRNNGSIVSTAGDMVRPGAEAASAAAERKSMNGETRRVPGADYSRCRGAVRETASGGWSRSSADTAGASLPPGRSIEIRGTVLAVSSAVTRKTHLSRTSIQAKKKCECRPAAGPGNGERDHDGKAMPHREHGWAKSDRTPDYRADAHCYPSELLIKRTARDTPLIQCAQAY